MPPADPLSLLRAICLDYPEATEKLTWDATPTFRVRDRIFALYEHDQYRARRTGLWCKAPPGAQQAMVDGDPARFYGPPYVGTRGWVGLLLEGDVDWALVAGLVGESYRMTAPRRLLARLEG